MKYWGQRLQKNTFWKSRILSSPSTRMCAGVRLTSQDIVCWHSRQQNVLVIGSLKVIVLAAVDTWRRFIVGGVILPLTRKTRGKKRMKTTYRKLAIIDLCIL